METHIFLQNLLTIILGSSTPSLANLVKHQYGVFEIGMSKQGEIRKLSKIVKPNIGIITNIGAAHIKISKT